MRIALALRPLALACAAPAAAPAAPPASDEALRRVAADQVGLYRRVDVPVFLSSSP